MLTDAVNQGLAAATDHSGVRALCERLIAAHPDQVRFVPSHLGVLLNFIRCCLLVCCVFV
jgi:hypothetical protein